MNSSVRYLPDKRPEARPCNGERLSAALFATSPEPLSITRLHDDAILLANESWLSALGYPPERVVGKSATALGVWRDAAERAAILARLETEGRVTNHATRFMRADGRPLDVLVSGTHIEYDGWPSVVWAWRDVTEIRELEAFSYSISHDLRAPLGAIHGFAHLLRRQESGRVSTDGVRLLAMLEENAARTTELLEGLLEFSRLGRKPVAKTGVSMNALVHDVLRQLRARPGAERAEFRLGPLPDSLGDRVLLVQVWSNLIDNALKYAQRSEPPVIEIGYEEASASYFVRDNGAGFDMRHAAKLFGVFERLHTEEEFEGSGVGLAIVRRIVERHGGRVSAEGEPGVGATFRFSLPD